MFCAKLALVDTDLPADAGGNAEDVMVREALRLGLDRSDPVVRTRLVQNMRFVTGEATRDEQALFAEALALGMAERDVVARRRLAQALEERLVAGTRVSDDDVDAYLARHAERYAGPARISFEHVFLSSDRHRGDLAVAAEQLRSRLAREPAAPPGDPFLLGRRFVAQSQAELARSFGGAFAAAAMQVPAGEWSEPIRSPYGVHFIRIDAIRAGGTLDRDVARRQAYYALLEEREREAVARELAALRGKS